MKTLFIFVMLVLVFASHSFAIERWGNVGGEHWDLDEDEYIVVGSCEVPHNETLTITGTNGDNKILFRDPGGQMPFHITVCNGNNRTESGRILVNENTHAPVVFTAEGDNPVSGQWNAIIINGDDEQTVEGIFRYCTFEYGGGIGEITEGGTIITLEGADVTMDHCTIESSATAGFLVSSDHPGEDYSNIQFDCCNFFENEDDGIAIYGENSHINIINCTISHCGDDGIAVLGENVTLTMADTDIGDEADNVETENGIRVGNNETDYNDCNITINAGCTISNVNENGIAIFSDRPNDYGESISLVIAGTQGQEVEIHDVGENGIFAADCFDNSYNLFYTKIFNCQRGVSIGGDVDWHRDERFIFNNCEFYDNTESGIWIHGSAQDGIEEEPWLNFQISNCNIYSNGIGAGGAINTHGGIFIETDALEVGGPKIESCTITSNEHNGATINLHSDIVFMVFQSIINENGQNGLYIETGCGATIVVDSTQFHSNGSFGYFYEYDEAVNQDGIFINRCDFRENLQGNIRLIIESNPPAPYFIQYNDFYGNGNNVGLLIDGAPTLPFEQGTTIDLSFKNNLFVNHGTAIELDLAETMAGRAEIEHRIFNNTFYNQSTHDIHISENHVTIPGAEMANNLFARSDSYEANEYAIFNEAGGNPTYSYNGFDEANIPIFGCQEDNSVVDAGMTFYELEGNYDAHLEWNSPMIDGGNPDDDPDDESFNDPDESRNDIGFMGGPDRDDFNRGEDYEMWYTIMEGSQLSDPFNVVDHYRMYGSCQVPLGLILNIDPGTLFEMFEGVTLAVAGELHINGVQGNPVFFTGYEDEIWYTIKFTSTASSNSFVNYAIIDKAFTGITFTMARENPNSWITLNNCHIFDCKWFGVDIYDSRVQIIGNAQFESLIENITDIDATTNSAGIRISNCFWGAPSYDVIVLNTRIRDCGALVVDMPSESGIIFSNSTAKIDNCTIEENGVTGLCMSSSWPDLGGMMGFANDVRHNGWGVQLPGNDPVNGAELALFNQSWPWIEFMDIVDIFQGGIHGMSIYKSTPDNDGMLFAVNCHWGTEGLPPWNWFFPQPFLDNFFIQPHSPAPIDFIDDVNTFEYGIELLNDDNPRGALRTLIWLIENRSGNFEAINSLRYLPTCYQLLDLDFDDLRTYFRRGEERFEESNMVRECRMMTPRSFQIEENYEEALGTYAEIQDNPIDEREEVMAELYHLELAHALEENEVDAALNHREFKLMRDKLLQKLFKHKDNVSNETSLSHFNMMEAYPNPFNNATTIKFNLREESQVRLSIHDLQGREVAVLCEGISDSGIHTYSWDASGLPSGLYICRMETSAKTTSIKLAMVR